MGPMVYKQGLIGYLVMLCAWSAPSVISDYAPFLTTSSARTLYLYACVCGSLGASNWRWMTMGQKIRCVCDTSKLESTECVHIAWVLTSACDHDRVSGWCSHWVGWAAWMPGTQVAKSLGQILKRSESSKFSVWSH